MRDLIEEFYSDPEKFSKSDKHNSAVLQVIHSLDQGKSRVCEKQGGEWGV